MGFSVSGGAAIVFAGLLLAFGMWSTATANTVERVNEAEAARTDGVLEQQNTAVEITGATWNGTHLIVDVDNAGAAQLRLSTTDLLIDGAYESDWTGNATVAGDAGTDLWLSGETATIELGLDGQPDRVTVVAASGVSDTAEVTVP
jgi:flagellar protein FlaF